MTTLEQKVYSLDRDKVRFFFDMDGVLADFDKHFQKYFPGVHDDDGWDWEDLHKVCPDIYSVCPPMKDMYHMLDHLSEYMDRWHILTAIPKRWSWPDVTHQKRSWVHRYIPGIDNEKIRFGPYAEDKQFHCTGISDILIDDKKRNIEQWNRRGGTGIHHTSAEQTLAQIRELGLIE